jgi:hypothetical protein
MAKAVLTRTNLLLESGKVRRLRKLLQSASHSEAVRQAIHDRLEVEEGLHALQNLRRLGGVENLSRRAKTENR